MTSVLFQLRQYGLSFASILVGGFGVLIYVYRYYRSVETSVPNNSWSARWEVSPESLGGFSYRQLALASVLGLFLELLMIRWISSEIRMFAYFKNFVLIACFLGFGLGCYQDHTKALAAGAVLTHKHLLGGWRPTKTGREI